MVAVAHCGAPRGRQSMHCPQINRTVGRGILCGAGRERRIGFVSTPFDHVSIDCLEPLRMDFWKIPSGEITNLPYLRKIGALGQPVVMSSRNLLSLSGILLWVRSLLLQVPEQQSGILRSRPMPHSRFCVKQAPPCRVSHCCTAPHNIPRPTVRLICGQCIGAFAAITSSGTAVWNFT